MAGNKLRGKTYLILGLIFVLTVGTVLFIVQQQTNSIIDELTLNRVQAANHSFINYFSELAGIVSRRAEVISGNEGFVIAMKSGDHQTLKRVLFNFSLGMDFASICDTEGVVLARSHGDLTGDNILGYKAVSAALRTGIPSTSIEVVESNGPRLSIYASVPIYDHGRIIGVVNCNYDLTKNEYVDEFKRRTGCEASIFLHDERISTTITDKFGNRVSDSKTYDFIIETVIRQQKEYLGELHIYDKVYGACYSPLLVDGEAIGMLFTGVDINSILERRRSMNLWIVLASSLGIVASMAFMIVSSKIARNYARLMEKQLNQQVLMANISRFFLSDSDTNTLITTTLSMIGEFMEISQVLLFMLEEDGITLTCRDEWADPKLNLASSRGRTIPFKEPLVSLIKDLATGTGKDSCLHSGDPDIRNTIAPFRVNYENYIITPIFVKGKFTGAIDFSRAGNNLEWSDSDISLATLFATTLSGVYEREAMGRRTSIVENSPHMIFYTDSNGNIAYANPAATEITGYTVDELKTGGFDLILDEQSILDVKDVHDPYTIQNRMIHQEATMICKDGRRRILELTSFTVKDGMTAEICMDVTELRAMESEMIKAKSEAEMASRAKSEFLSNMSHEMRTPMNAVINMTAIARNSAENERKNWALSKVEEASTYLLGIINDVLDMTKIEANKLELVQIEFDLRNVLQKAVSLIDFRMEEKRHKFSMNVDNNVPFFYSGDDQRLTQVIVNLLSNAVKFTPEDGSISINVSLIGEDDRICWLRFEVADSGIGIAPENHERIFHMFEQAESGTTRKYGGTGLGLVISKHIVELMGGEISVESEPGKGSRFIFTVKLSHIETDTFPQQPKLPTHKPGFAGQRSSEKSPLNAGASRDGEALGKKPGEKPGEKPGIIPAEKEGSEFAGKRLLLAEDIEINREILICLLDDAGLIIDTAENGKEALDKTVMNHDSYDLVFMDIQMPEMDGLEATRNIRAFEKKLCSASNSDKPFRRLPIIAMTANVFKDDIENCLAAGMDDHVGKPLDIGMVFEKLRKYL